MRIRHVVVFVWNDDVTDEQVAGVTAGLEALAKVVPGIEHYEFGPDVGINDGNAQYGIVADFASEEDYLVYRDHPDHQAFIAEVIRPIAKSRSAIQHERTADHGGAAGNAS
jgi:hypothetical protein